MAAFDGFFGYRDRQRLERVGLYERSRFGADVMRYSAYGFDYQVLGPEERMKPVLEAALRGREARGGFRCEQWSYGWPMRAWMQAAADDVRQEREWRPVVDVRCVGLLRERTDFLMTRASGWCVDPVGLAVNLGMWLCVATVIGWEVRERMRASRRRRAVCGWCGYDLRGGGAGVCPECGGEIGGDARQRVWPTKRQTLVIACVTIFAAISVAVWGSQDRWFASTYRGPSNTPYEQYLTGGWPARMLTSANRVVEAEAPLIEGVRHPRGVGIAITWTRDEHRSRQVVVLAAPMGGVVNVVAWSALAGVVWLCWRRMWMLVMWIRWRRSTDVRM